MTVSSGVTQLLIKWSQGDERALEQLTPLVYDELRQVAAVYLRQQHPMSPLQATALVHEAYLQLLAMRQLDWKSRAHFVNVAAQMMRRILVDHTRQQLAVKRGGGSYKLPLSRAKSVVAKQPSVDLIALDEALTDFANKFPRQAKVTELYFFGGIQVEEIPSIMLEAGYEMSKRTTERDLTFARAWLHQEITQSDKLR